MLQTLDASILSTMYQHHTEQFGIQDFHGGVFFFFHIEVSVQRSPTTTADGRRRWRRPHQSRHLVYLQRRRRRGRDRVHDWQGKESSTLTIKLTVITILSFMYVLSVETFFGFS
ncbi:hypothetical protein CsSME_00041647 [Camellia sinensis var. sinensis]